MSAIDVKKHGGLDRSWRLSCRALLSVFWLDERCHDVESRRCGHPALLPSLDGAPRDSAEIGKRLSGQPALVADSLDAWSVVHKRPVIREDDGLPVGRRAVVGRHSHGSEGLELAGFVFGEFAAAPDPAFFVFGDLDADALAVAAPASGTLSLGKRIESRAEFAVGGAVSAKLVSNGELAGDGVGGGHCFSGWSLASLPLTRTNYAILRKGQQLFTQTCAFFNGPFLVHSTIKWSNPH